MARILLLVLLNGSIGYGCSSPRVVMKTVNVKYSWFKTLPQLNTTLALP